jgi:hypothetical protein
MKLDCENYSVLISPKSMIRRRMPLIWSKFLLVASQNKNTNACNNWGEDYSFGLKLISCRFNTSFIWLSAHIILLSRLKIDCLHYLLASSEMETMTRRMGLSLQDMYILAKLPKVLCFWIKVHSSYYCLWIFYETCDFFRFKVVWYYMSLTCI